MNIPPIPEHDFTILLVDDRPENLLSLEEILLKPGRQFLKAQSGNEALKQVLKHDNIGLIMLDVQMPEMDGFELVEILKSNPKTRDIMVVFVTAISINTYAFREFGDFSLNYEVVYYVETSDYNKYMDVQQEINLAIKEAFEKEKIEFAFR